MRLSSGRGGRHEYVGRLAVGLAICAAAATGCATAPSAPPATSTPSAPSAAPAVKPECAAVTTAAATVGKDLTAYLAGQGDPDQLRTSAQNLSTALSQARTALGADGSRLDGASAALQQLISALQERPVDQAAVREAAQQLLTSLDDVFSVCSPASGTPTPTP